MNVLRKRVRKDVSPVAEKKCLRQGPGGAITLSLGEPAVPVHLFKNANGKLAIG